MKNEDEAIQEYEELTYSLAKEVAKLNEIRQRMRHINESMGWDGMFELDFDEAMVNLANVEAAAITYTLEKKYRENDIKQLREQADALDDCRKAERYC